MLAGACALTLHQQPHGRTSIWSLRQVPHTSRTVVYCESDAGCRQSPAAAPRSLAQAAAHSASTDRPPACAPPAPFPTWLLAVTVSAPPAACINNSPWFSLPVLSTS